MHDSRRTRLMLGVLLAAALALITFDSWGGAVGAASPVAGLRGIGGTVFGSAESLVGAVTRPVAAFFGNVTGAPYLAAADHGAAARGHPAPGGTEPGPAQPGPGGPAETPAEPWPGGAVTGSWPRT